MLAEVRELCLRQRYPMSELPINDLNVAVERAKHGDDRDGAIRTMRESVEAVFARHQVGYAIHSGCDWSRHSCSAAEKPSTWRARL